MTSSMNVFRAWFVAGLFFLAPCCSWSQKIGLLLDSYVLDRWYKDQQFFDEHVRELGGECVVEVAHGDADVQASLGTKMLASGIAALVIVPVDGQKAAAIVADAKKANIPVIAYDRFIASKDLSFYISYNNLAVGTLQARYAADKVPAGSYLLINGPVSDNNAILFRKGQLEVLKPSVDEGKIRIIGDIVLNSWSEMEAMMKMDEFLASQQGRPDVVLAANDAIAMGVIQTLPKELAGKVLVTGQDADLLSLKYIVGGSQAMTIYKPIKPLAQAAAEVAMTLAKGRRPPKSALFRSGEAEVSAILLEPLVVDKTNYRQTVVKDNYVRLSDIE